MNDKAIATDHRGVPASHLEAREYAEFGPDHRGPALARHEAAEYTNLPLMPKAVQAAKANMDAAAELVRELDEAALGVLDEYRAAPREAARKAAEAVAAGKVPESTEDLDARLGKLAVRYRDSVAHRKAVEAHLVKLVDDYHRTAEAAYPAWRDAIAAEMESRAERARVALSKALPDARTVYALAAAVESMDRPVRRDRDERPRVSALAGKALPEVFDIDRSRGQGGVNYATNTKAVAADLDAIARVATTWLRVDGRQQLGQGPIPEAFTVPVADLPDEDPEAKRAEAERAANERRARDYLARMGRA
ncbi:hypothetical protein ACWGSK_26955 [Nocardiopsis sp. NPDC055551]